MKLKDLLTILSSILRATTGILLTYKDYTNPTKLIEFNLEDQIVDPDKANIMDNNIVIHITLNLDNDTKYKVDQMINELKEELCICGNRDKKKYLTEELRTLELIRKGSY